MVDPLTALGLASNIVQLVDVGAKILKDGRELANTGTTEQCAHIRRLVDESRSVSNAIKATSRNYGSPDDLPGPGSSDRTGHSTERVRGPDEATVKLHELAAETCDVAEELSAMLNRVTLSNGNAEQRPGKRRRVAVKQAVRGMLRHKDLETLRARLGDLHQALILRYASLQW